MTPLPKRKHTRSRTGKRRNSPSNQTRLPNLVTCKSCGQLRIAHTACLSCKSF